MFIRTEWRSYMSFLRMLEQIRCPALDTIMQLITEFGGELIFLLVALVLFWCINKRQGYYLMAVGFVGTIFNQFLKIACQIPRPWVRDPNFTIVESARAGATGYSFPSGHSQNAVGTFGAIAMCNHQKWLRVFCIIVAILVPFSRMYLGVHTPADVLVGAGMALVLVFLLKPICFKKDGGYIPALFAVMVVLAVGFLAYTELYPFGADVDAQNLHSAIKNAYTLMGALLGMLIVYYVDEKVLHFPTQAVWYAQIAKVVCGLILVLLVKECLKAPLDVLFHGHMVSRTIRYFLVVISAGIVWPLTFPWFSRIGQSRNKSV